MFPYGREQLGGNVGSKMQVRHKINKVRQGEERWREQEMEVKMEAGKLIWTSAEGL